MGYLYMIRKYKGFDYTIKSEKNNTIHTVYPQMFSSFSDKVTPDDDEEEIVVY